jgi:hypothetical protein
LPEVVAASVPVDAAFVSSVVGCSDLGARLVVESVALVAVCVVVTVVDDSGSVLRVVDDASVVIAVASMSVGAVVVDRRVVVVAVAVVEKGVRVGGADLVIVSRTVIGRAVVAVASPPFSLSASSPNVPNVSIPVAETRFALVFTADPSTAVHTRSSRLLIQSSSADSSTPVRSAYCIVNDDSEDDRPPALTTCA